MSMSPVPINRSVFNESATLEMSSTNPKLNDQLSVFGETSCGEPLVPQRLLIDFTPNDEDNDFVQRKICTFWKFIDNTPEIQNLMVLPERETYAKVTATDYKLAEASQSGAKLVSTKSEQHSDVSIDLGGTAVSKLELVEEKGLINRIFEAKMEQSGCTLGSREYKENALSTTQKKKKQICKCTTICEVCSGLTPPANPRNSTVKKLCKQMEEWDANHHKSMASPSHPPSLIHSVLQRQVYPSDA